MHKIPFYFLKRQYAARTSAIMARLNAPMHTAATIIISLTGAAGCPAPRLAADFIPPMCSFREFPFVKFQA